MAPASRQIAFINVAHGFCHYCLLILPTAVLAMAAPGGAFAAIYHPVGTAMLVEAAGDRPGRAIGVNGVSGNFGVALAPVVTAGLAGAFGWHAAFVAQGLAFVAAELLWLRVPAFDYIVLAAVALAMLACAWYFPDRPGELRPELWAAQPGAVAAE